MANEEITVTPYNGALLGTQLLSSAQTIILGNFGNPISGTLTDDDGTLSDADDGTALFQGQPIDYIGSGTAQAGVDLGIGTVGIGPEVDIVVFEANSQVYFYYPAGRPSVVGKIAEVIDISPVAYDVFTPICFCSGTLIRTTDGDIPVEEVGPGTRVIDIDGQAHDVLWAGARHLTIPPSESYRKWLPVRISRNTFGDGVPYLDTYVSQQHRLLISTIDCHVIFGEPCLAPAKALIDCDRIAIDHARTRVDYHHILCGEHVVLVANGMPAESMFLGDVAKNALGHRDYGAVLDQFAHIEMTLAHPVLRTYEARSLMRTGLRDKGGETLAAVTRISPPGFQPAPKYSEARVP